MALLSHDSAVLMATLSQNLAVGTTESKLNGVNDTTEYMIEHHDSAVSLTLLSQFEKLVKDLSSFKEKIKPKFKQGIIIMLKAFETKT
jgi:uncharacterized protein (DUF305 family)